MAINQHLPIDSCNAGSVRNYRSRLDLHVLRTARRFNWFARKKNKLTECFKFNLIFLGVRFLLGTGTKKSLFLCVCVCVWFIIRNLRINISLSKDSYFSIYLVNMWILSGCPKQIMKAKVSVMGFC